ncbi:MAG TPA: ATP-binding protein [Candidatus Omnitrophota bacterium]|nr:ATP-binding protein [Candidatus Omnitrophota bacterium]
MIHYLKNIYSDLSGFERIACIYKEAKDLFADDCIVDFSRCSFFEANMASPLAAVLAKIADDFNNVKIINIPGKIATILRKNGFLKLYGFPGLYDQNETTVPFRRIRKADQGLFEEYLNRHLKGKGLPEMTAKLDRAFKQSVFEVFQNAVMHADSDSGIFVCGQFYPHKKKLDLTISDAGVGIRDNVRHYFKNQKISSVEAIRWAMREGNTTKSGAQPGGLGLKLLRDFIEQNNGRIQIASRLGFFEFQTGTETFSRMSADFPGTAVNLEINTADPSSYCLTEEISPDNFF